MNKAVIYIHGKGGSSAEAEHYKPLFAEYAVRGFDYAAETPWEAKVEFSQYFNKLGEKYDEIILVANSIGAFFTMNAQVPPQLKQAYFISPVVDMERLISDMMGWVGVTETELQERGTIETAFGETLSWEYLSYVRENPLRWEVPTRILYGEKDTLTSRETITAFAERTGAALEIMRGGEHWFHTEQQMRYLDAWIMASK